MTQNTEPGSLSDEYASPVDESPQIAAHCANTPARAKACEMCKKCLASKYGTPRQCSCLENPTDGGAWWAAVMGSLRVGHD